VIDFVSNDGRSSAAWIERKSCGRLSVGSIMSEWSSPNAKFPPPKADEPSLIKAARIGDHAAIRRLISEGKEIDALYDIGLDPGAHPHPCTPLMVAAGSGDGATVETVQLLISLGADPKKVAAYGSAATCACTGLGWNYRPGGDAERLQLLINAGSPLALQGREGARLVANTAATGDSLRLGVLIHAGAPVNAVFDPALAKDDWTRIAAWSSNLFSDKQIPVGDGDLESEVDDITEKILREMREKLASAPSSSDIPLMCAAESGSAACVELLLRAGADVNVIDNMRGSALFYAASAGVVHALVDAGIDIHHVDERAKDALQHILENMAAEADELTKMSLVCDAMLQAGLPLVARADECHRLYDAAFAENEHAVRWLLQAGHAVTATEHRGTALHALCWHWDYGDERDDTTRAIVRMLLEAGVDPTATCSNGNTALHESVAGDGTNLVAATELLNAGADVNARNNDGQTPLVYFYETLFDYGLVVPFLLQHGANPLVPNNRGKNAIDIARQMIAGANPDWRTEQWCGEDGPPCGWKQPAEPGDEEHEMLDLLLKAASRFGG